MVKLESHGLIEALNVRVIGSGEQILVLSHGFGDDQSTWKDVLPYLVPDFKVIVFDMIFSGSVDPKYFDFDRYTDSLSAYADDLLAILEELKVDKCVYVGHSVSAMVGCLASIKKPELFERLILLCGSPRYLNGESYEGGFERGAIDGIFDAVKSNYSAWASGFASLLIGVDEPSVVEEFSGRMMSIKPEIALVVAKSIFESDMRSILCNVKIPCSIIQSPDSDGRSCSTGCTISHTTLPWRGREELSAHTGHRWPSAAANFTTYVSRAVYSDPCKVLNRKIILLSQTNGCISVCFSQNISY